MARSSQQLTPMVRQYQQIKAHHPDEILLYRIGDFYETFGEDAKTTAEVLGIVLTRKHVGKGQTLPLAGIPYHALESYLAKLVRAGHRVAICEQIGDPKAAKGVVDREVTRVVTPGTLIEENLLEDKTANYLVAFARHRGNWGLALADLSTGALGATEFSGEQARPTLMSELTRINPSEALATDADWELLEPVIHASFGSAGPSGMLRTRVDRGMTRYDAARRVLLDHFGVSTLQGFGAEDVPAAVCTAGALVAYLQETQRRSLGHIRALRIYSVRETMGLDATTRRSLELTRNMIDGGRSATLLEVLDHTATPMGGRLLREWILQPLQDLEAIAARQDSIESLLADSATRQRLAETLRGVRDLERILGRVHCGTANARDLRALTASLGEVPAIKAALQRLEKGRARTIGDHMETLADLADRLDAALVPDPPVTLREGGMIRDGVNADLDELRAVTRNGKGWIARMKADEIERTGIPSLKIGYNKVFGYYIEVRKANLQKVPEHYQRRQTLTNAERFITPDLKQKEEQILGAQDKIGELEYDIFEQLRELVKSHTGALQRLAAGLAEADALASLARAALIGGYVRPIVDGSDLVQVEAGRHPVLEALMAERPFVPNDVELDSHQQQIWLITGPNMAGKSTFIRQVALLALMAHIGAFVPARSARFGLIDRIFTRVGATDYIARGQSTFLVEMTETANILHHATERSLVILDEIGRGTSTYDGLSIAWAVVEYLHEKPRRRARTLFATHYHELTDLEGRLDRVRNYNVAVKEDADGIAFLYQIIPGGANRSYGIFAAKLAGMPEETLERARQILFRLECHRPATEDLEGAGEDTESAPPPAHRDVDVMQMDLFEPLVPPELDRLRDLDVNQLTPMQALQILNKLVKAMKK